MELIRSADNPAVKQLGKLLSDARARREAGLAVAEGPHLVGEGLRAGLGVELWATPEAIEGPEAKALLSAAKGLMPRMLSAGLAKRLSELPAPQGWLLVCKAQPKAMEALPLLTLALDSIQDPGNIGTLLRSAWATGASVLLGPGCADPWSPKVLRAGVGAQFHVPFQPVTDLAAELRSLSKQGATVFAAAPHAADEWTHAPLTGPVCFALGAEGPGLSAAVQAACGSSLRINYPGGAESLNVAVTGALLLFEALRQRASASTGR
jgi:TrmH family RNA methyltransferase